MIVRPTCVLILSEVLSGPDNPWFRDASVPVIRHLAERSEVFPLRWRGTESELLGLARGSVRLEEGPLTVACLGADPPARSVHFRISPLALVDDRLRSPQPAPTTEELAQIGALAKKLETPSLRVLSEGELMALVWERGSLEMATTPPDELADRAMKSVLPEGDGEPALRRFIDDAINLLHEEEFNLRRIDEGLDPVNVLWPWGQGFRAELPNLPIARGKTASFASNSVRLEGAALLARYRHYDRVGFGRGTSIRLEQLANWAAKQETAVVWIREPGAFRADGSDEMRGQYEWLLREIDERFVKPIAEREVPPLIAILAPGDPGLGLIFDSEKPAIPKLPFDERALEEPQPTRELSDLMRELLS